MDLNCIDDELQSRREFFKKGAKTVLPILGAVTIINIPSIVQAQKTPMGCEYACSNSCEDSCLQSCKYTCTCTCAGDCVNSCLSNCNVTCKGTCLHACAAYFPVFFW
ncbi:MAG: Cys-Xaa-Xaa-Xaa repeat radical SAM target protein [Bacteroidales bacterium]|nr:Cys-Xaa-Xaa-Xaa repeat radical SAM target protein [Bacteroidales bacterium]